MKVPSSFKSLAITLLLGFLGALIATWVGLPAAPLVGASLLVSFASFFKVTTEVPLGLRNAAFSIIGCSLGSGITKEALAQSLNWPTSLLALAVAVFLIILIGSRFLTRFFALSPETAVLATAPGAISYILAYAANGYGDIRAIIVIQNIRLVVVATLLPFLITHIGFTPVHTGVPDISSFPASFTVIAIALILGRIMMRWEIPASYLLAGMLISGLGHYSDLVSGRSPYLLLFLGFTIIGTIVGTRFASITCSDFRQQLLSSICIVIVAGGLAAIFAYAVSACLKISYGQMFVAFAPGGIEAMAAITLALGYDPAFVTIHHLFRTLLLFVFVPFFIKRHG